MSEELQELHRQVNAAKTKRAALIKEIKRLKTESGMKLEAIVRSQEKKNALSMEAKERVSEHKKLEEGLKDKLEAKKTSPTKRFVEEENDNFADSEEREKLVEKFTSLLENKVIFPIQKHVKRYLNDAYNIDENEEAEDDRKVYAKSQIVSTIMVVLEDSGVTSPTPMNKRRDDALDTITEDTPLSEPGSFAGETQNYLTTFRVAGSTTINQFKEMACKFWNKKIDQYDFFDEKGDALVESKKDKAQDRNLERFFKHRKNDLTQLMVIMRPKQSLKLDSVQISMKSRKGRRESEIEKEEENRYNAIDPFSNFGLLLPKLKAYLQVHKEETEQRDREHKKMNKPSTFGESHICIALTIIVLLILTILSILNPRDLYRERYTIESVNRLIDDSEFKTIATVDDILTNLINIGNNFFSDSPGATTDYVSLHLYKPIYIRQYQVREKECQVNINKKCYYDNYDYDTRKTSTYTDKYDNQYVFNFHDNTDFEGKMNGYFGEYTNDAYVSSFDTSTMTKTQFFTAVCQMFMQTQVMIDKCKTITGDTTIDVGTGTSTLRYITPNTKAIRITLNMVDISQRTFFIVEPLIEYTSAGTLLTTLGKPVVFRPNTKDNLTINEKAINIILVLLATFLLIFVLYRLFTKENVTIHFGYFLTLPGLLNFLIIILVYACNSLNNSFNGLNMNEQQMLNNPNKTAFNEMARKYEALFIVKSILAGLLIVRVALLAKIHTRVQVIVSGLENSLPRLISLIIVLAPVLLALSFFGYASLGQNNMYFANYSGAVMVISMLLIGLQIDILSEYNAAENIILIIGFCFIFFMLLSLVAAINVENYRQNKMDYNETYHKTYTWKSSDYKKWLLSWVPSGLTKTKAKLTGKLGAGLKQNLNMDKLKKIKDVFKKKETASTKALVDTTEHANILDDPKSPISPV